MKDFLFSPSLRSVIVIVQGMYADIALKALMSFAQAEASGQSFMSLGIRYYSGPLVVYEVTCIGQS